MAVWFCKNPRRVLQLAMQGAKLIKTLALESTKPGATISTIMYAVLKGTSVEVLRELVKENPEIHRIIATVLNPSGKYC